MNTELIYNGFTTMVHLLKLILLKYRFNNCEFALSIKLCGRIKFNVAKKGFLKIGKGSVITGGAFTNCLGCLRGSCIGIDNDAEVIIGEKTGMSDISIRARKKIIIGNYVTIGAGTIINDSNSHSLDYLERRYEHNKEKNVKEVSIVKAPIIIEDDVFIGAQCIIGKGVTIGARSIIAAGSVVVKNIPSDELWGGNPCRFIRKLN